MKQTLVQILAAAALVGGREHAAREARERQRLQPHLAGAGELREEQAFAAEQDALHAADGLHVKVDGLRERDDAARIDVQALACGELALDLGGLHGPVQGSIMLDNLGLTEGSFYAMDVFHAERCGSGSNFRIDTSIGCIEPQ